MHVRLSLFFLYSSPKRSQYSHDLLAALCLVRRSGKSLRAAHVYVSSQCLLSCRRQLRARPRSALLYPPSNTTLHDGLALSVMADVCVTP
jgi:hypothetical protein